MGGHAKRTVPMTGTPYSNNTSEFAALMAMINPAHVSARKHVGKPRIITTNYNHEL